MYEDESLKGKNYVLYLRKSTDDASKQVRSIEDQESSCRELAKREGLHIEETIFEERSAKRSRNRPKFTAMIEGVAKGKFDGILAWHPDRLARNMKEAGEIIDLLDEGYLVDLKFAAHRFINDYNGKMALGIDFVLAKQYTDKLSIDVKRGILKALMEGKSGGQYKPGYIRNPRTGLYEPDEAECSGLYNYFGIVRKAWEMRIEGGILKDIADYMNKHGYGRTLKKRPGTIQLMSAQKLVSLFQDPFYYGLLKQGGQSVLLTEIYDFTPMVTEIEFNIVHGMIRNDLRQPKKHFYPFKSIVFCNSCGANLSAGASKGVRTPSKILYFWCPNRNCKDRGKIRARKIVDEIQKILENLTHNIKDHYPLYYEDAHKIVKKNRAEYASQTIGIRRHLEDAKSKYEKMVVAVHETQAPNEKKILEAKKNKYSADVIKWEKELSKVEELHIKGKAFTADEFLNHVESLSTSFIFGDPSIKDEIAKNVILNLKIGHHKIASGSLNEPFKGMLNPDFILFGGPAWT